MPFTYDLSADVGARNASCNVGGETERTPKYCRDALESDIMSPFKEFTLH